MTRHAKRYELGGRRHFEKMRLKVNLASRKNSTPKRVSKRSLTYYKTGSKAFFMLRFSATRLSNILYDIKCSLLNDRRLCRNLGSRGNFWVKVIHVDFQLEKCMQFKKNDVSNFYLQY